MRRGALVGGVMATLVACGAQGADPADAGRADAPGGSFGMCAGTSGATREMIRGQLRSASPEGAMMLAADILFWPTDAAAPVVLHGISSFAIVSGDRFYWPGDAGAVFEATLDGTKRAVPLAASDQQATRILRDPRGGVFVLTTPVPNTIQRIAPGATSAELLTTATGPGITSIEVGPDAIVWLDGTTIKRRTLSTGDEAIVALDAVNVDLLGVRATDFVVRTLVSPERYAIERRQLGNGDTVFTTPLEKNNSAGAFVSFSVGGDFLYTTQSSAQVIIMQVCSYSGQLSRLSLTTPNAPLATLIGSAETDVFAEPGIVYAQVTHTASNCCYGNGSSTCPSGPPPLPPPTVMCFRP